MDCQGQPERYLALPAVLAAAHSHFLPPRGHETRPLGFETAFGKDV